MGTKRQEREQRGIVQTGLDIAIGGTAMAIDKASDLIQDARSQVREAADDARKKAGVARKQAEKDVRRAEKAAEELAGRIAEKLEDQAHEVGEKVERHLTGPDSRPYEERTVEELRELAAEREIHGRSKMNKSDLIGELRS